VKIEKDAESGWLVTTKLFQVSFGFDWMSWHIGIWFANLYVFSVTAGPLYAVFHIWRRRKRKNGGLIG